MVKFHKVSLPDWKSDKMFVDSSLLPSLFLDPSRSNQKSYFYSLKKKARWLQKAYHRKKWGLLIIHIKYSPSLVVRSKYQITMPVSGWPFLIITAIFVIFLIGRFVCLAECMLQFLAEMLIKPQTAQEAADPCPLNIYTVTCQRGGVSNEPPWLQAATRHGASDPLVR